MYFLPAFRQSGKSIRIRLKTKRNVKNVYLQVHVFSLPSSLPIPIFHQEQNRWYPANRQHTIMANVMRFRGRMTISTIPTPIQKQIRPHSRFIPSPDRIFTVFYAALLFFILLFRQSQATGSVLRHWSFSFPLRKGWCPLPHPHLCPLYILAR